MAAKRADAFFASASTFSRVHRQPLAEMALKLRLPSMFGAKENVDPGGLLSYAPDLIDLTRRAATYIRKILRGARPAELPVEQASRYLLAVNLKTAKALGLSISETFLIRADAVIE
jgi:putative tryptophan/tyrosine transport system substrate-binding protein